MTTGRPATAWPFAGRDAEVAAALAVLGGEQARGVLLLGEAGSGKSRLAEAIAARWEADGGTIVRLVATPSARDIPLGAVAHLLPRDVALFGTSDAELDRLRVFQAADEACHRLTTLDRALVLIDDIDMVDGLSAVLICRQLETTTVRVVATMRSDARPIEDIMRLRSSGKLAELQVGPLDRPAVAAIAGEALGGPPDPATLAALTQTSQGNALLLRELVTGALERHDLEADAAGSWHLRRPLVGTRHLHDLVDERLRTLPPDAVRALEVLAVAGELPLHLLEDVVGPAALDALDGASLVAFRTDGARAFIRTVHPVHDEVMRARVGVLARRRHFGELAVALQRRGARRREDAVRLALWHLESGHGADVDLLLRAARLSLAFLDPEPAIRLATAARTAGSAAASALIIAEARSIQGRYDDVEAVLALGAHDVSSLPDADRARFAGRRASNLVHGLGDADAAEAVLRRALAASTSEEGSRFLRGKQAGMEAVSGDVERAEAAVDELLRSDDLETRVQAGYAGGFAFLHDARVEATLEVTRAAYRDHVALEGTPGHGHPASQLVSATLALAIGGRLDEADVMVDEFRRGSERTANALGLLLAHMLDGEVATLRGDLERARQGYARAALAAGEQRGWVADKALTGRGLVAAWMGDHDAARTTLDQADATPMAVRWPRFERDRLRGWVAWLEGRPDHAEEVFATAADAAASLHDRWMEAVLRHDIVRLGRATDVDRLTHLAGACDAVLVHDLADHARARAERDATGLVDAADDLERHGFAGLAVGALADAAVVSAAAGDQRAARELRRRMAVVATRCPGLHLADLGEGDVVEPLTDREREIALLAAARRSNKEIAEQLYLSVRTVENHLAKVYEKLGVKGRRDLVAALEAER